MDSPTPIRAKSWPWATAIVALAAMITFTSVPLSDIFVYRRSLIFAGQIWRTWTGHIVHFGPSHLIWDLAVFIPAGCWLEILCPRCARWLYFLGPIVISIVLLALEPSLERYAGLSGLAIGTLVLLAVSQLQRQPESSRLWLCVLGLVLAKLVMELRQGAPLLVSDFAAIRNVPLAHFSGIGCGLVCWKIFGRSISKD